MNHISGLNVYIAFVGIVYYVLKLEIVSCCRHIYVKKLTKKNKFAYLFFERHITLWCSISHYPSCVQPTHLNLKAIDVSQWSVNNLYPPSLVIPWCNCLHWIPQCVHIEIKMYIFMFFHDACCWAVYCLGMQWTLYIYKFWHVWLLGGVWKHGDTPTQSYKQS